MSASDRSVRIFNCKYVIYSVLIAFSLIYVSPGGAEPATAQGPTTTPSTLGGDGSRPTMDELRAHAVTINDILETASERVDLLATTDTDAPALVEAIRQELSLTRRWNRHLGTILLDVAEARRALSRREREAAKEITRLTAVAEEARLELMMLKKVLKERPEQAQRGQDAWLDGQLNKEEAEPSTDSRLASNFSIDDDQLRDATDLEAGVVRDTREMLASVQAAEESVVRDVDAVRGKIIEALETLATVRGDLPMGIDGDDAALSSKNITSWAASMATRLNRASRTNAD